MATLLASEVNGTNRDVTGPTKQVQIMCSVKDKILINNAGYMKPFFLGLR